MTAVVIPTLGGGYLSHCLEAVTQLDPAPARALVVRSGGGPTPVTAGGFELVESARRLGFAAAVNAGVRRVSSDCNCIAVLNDDAVPAPGWLAPLQDALAADDGLAAVQGTVTDLSGAVIDGRGIALDPVGLPIQVDRGASPAPEPADWRELLAVSGTAALFRREALNHAALTDGAVFDPAFDSYYEDLDLGLRLRRLGWRAAWIPGAWSSHVGSATSRRLGWRHPWWILGNRWRALAGNLTTAALARAAPLLLRGEVRAVCTLVRSDARALPASLAVAVTLPWVLSSGFRRPSPGPRLSSLPETGA